jgi:hypothetical protein
VVTILAVLMGNWLEVSVPEFAILYYMTGFMTALSGIHYLVTSRRYLEEE